MLTREKELSETHTHDYSVISYLVTTDSQVGEGADLRGI